MNKSKLIIVVLVAILLLSVVVFSVLYFNSYSFALRKVGIQSKYATIVDSGINSNGDQYQVVAECAPGDIHIAYLVKNSVGFWYVERTNETQISSNGVQFGWTNVASIRRYETTDSSIVEFENHYLYCNDNAIKRISVLEEDLPHNVTVNIHQAGSVYMLHFITFDGSGEVLNEIDCYSILKNAGCVQ